MFQHKQRELLSNSVVYNHFVKHKIEITKRVLALLVLIFLISTNTVQSAGEWGTRPLLSYFALTASLEVPLRMETRFTQEESAKIEIIAKQEEAELRILLRDRMN